MTNQLEGENINEEGNASLPSVEGSEMNSTTQSSDVCSSSTCASELSTSAKKERQQEYDYVEKEIDEELLCSICLHPFIEPTSHGSCGSTFCYSCIENLPNCPICSAVDFKNNCSSVKMIRNMLDKLEVKCGMCKNNVLRGELKDHQDKYCPLKQAYKEAEELKKKLQTDYQNNLDVLTQEFNEKSKQLEGKYEELTTTLKQEHEQLVNQTTCDLNQKTEAFNLEWKQKNEDLEKSIELKENNCNENIKLKESTCDENIKLKEEALQNRIEEFEKQVYTREKLENSNKPIHLNVRGTIMTVSLGDFIHNEIEPDNLFKKMFTEQHPCYQTPCTMFSGEVYFIDCDPIVFKHILEWLKFGVIATELSNDMKRSIINVCKKFDLKNMINEFKDESNKFNMKNLLNLHKMQRRSLNLNGYNFRDLVHSDFSGMNLENANFSGLILKGCNFTNCNLENANFKDCDLSESIFCKTITGVDFSGSNLSKINFNEFKFENVNFTNTKIQNSKFENAIFTNCKISMHFNNQNELKNCKFISCDFNGSIFEEIDFKLIQNNLETTQFNNCTFKGYDLKELKDLSKFNGSKFDSCLFNFNEFTNKHIQNIQFQNIDLQSMDFKSFQFTQVSFQNCLNVTSNFISSNIFNDNSISLDLYSHTKSKSIPQLLYRGSRDGFKAEQFHSKCDDKGPTLTIIKSEYNQIFGAFTSQSWQSPQDGKYVSDSSAFIFKICQDSTNQNYQFKKFNIKQDEEQYAIYLYKDYLPRFGGGHDICISSDCNLNNYSRSNFGETYELPNEYKYESNEAESYLAGSENFKVCEIEVFKINQ